MPVDVTCRRGWSRKHVWCYLIDKRDVRERATSLAHSRRGGMRNRAVRFAFDSCVSFMDVRQLR